MILVLGLAAALTPPDPAPLRAALDSCDRGAIARLTATEPRRRAAFSSAAYDEQREIAAERARIDVASLTPVAPTTAADPAVAERARLEARQRRLDDARTVERAWRDSLEESRSAFLAHCTGHRDPEHRP